MNAKPDVQVKKISSCRVCGSKKLSTVLFLGDQYVSNFVEAKENNALKVPLELVLCDSKDCSLLQLRHSTSTTVLYRNYWYKSGVNKTMRDALAEIAEKAEKIAGLQTGDLVLDIGCNDGTLLRSYKKNGLKLVGFDPAKNLLEFSMVGTTKIFNDFFNAKEFIKEFGEVKAKAITSIAMFYDLDDPNSFVNDIVHCLDAGGVWIIQMSYLPLMLEQNAFDNICVKPETIILGDNKPINQIEMGGSAIGENGELMNVKNTMKRKFNGKLISIKPKYLNEILLTPEHPVKIIRKEIFRFKSGQIKPTPGTFHPEWVQAKNVGRGDYVVLPKLPHRETAKSISLEKFNRLDSPNYRKGLLSFPIDNETAWLLGLYIAEGHTGGKKNNPYINFTLNRKETNILDRLNSIFKKLGYATNLKLYEDRNSMEVRTVCASLARALKEWAGNGAVNKRIPDFILSAPKEIKISLLRGLFEGDGYIKKNKVHFHTSSKILALQVQLLVASLDGLLGISYVKPYPREIRGGKVISKDSWQLRGSSKALAKIFGYKHVGPEINHCVIKDAAIFVPVKKVGFEPYNGIVHNIETQGNTYLVSNAVVHNCHEHLEYYSLHSLEKLLKMHDLEIFDAELNDVNGGSFIVYVKHKSSKKLGISKEANYRLIELEKNEKKLGLSEKKAYHDFAKRVNELKKKAVDFISMEAYKEKIIYVYGASTKGNTLLQFYGLDNQFIKFAAERNPDKFGRKTVGTLIPIISEEQARKDNPDYFLVLPWHFVKEFVFREADYLKNGGKFIVPLPEFTIIGKEALTEKE